MSTQFVSNVFLPLRTISSRTSNNNFKNAFFVVFIIPLRAQRDYFIVQLNADSSAHTNNHGFAIKNTTALFPVIHNALAIRFMRSGLPTTFSSLDHLDLRYSLLSISSPSVTSSNSIKERSCLRFKLKFGKPVLIVNFNS